VFKAQEILRKVRSGELVVGAHVFFAHYEITEAFGWMGYDFVWIDGEHSAFDREKILQNIIAANSGGTASFVRVAWNDPILIKPILEMGPDGIILPMIYTAENGSSSGSGCLHLPARRHQGLRSQAGQPLRHHGYGRVFGPGKPVFPAHYAD